LLALAEGCKENLMLVRPNERQLQGARVESAFRRDVLNGLSYPPRAIPARWLYDRSGSELFEAITRLPDYYPSRTERLILSTAASELADLIGPGRAIVEIGSGSSTKKPILLSAVRPSAYVPIDISIDFLSEAVESLSGKFPDLPIYPLQGDFTEAIQLPGPVAKMQQICFFPGSTIGNLTVSAAVDLLRMIAAALGQGAMLLIGVDRIKDVDVLLSAYDDAQGVTAAFNLNLLHRINRELEGSIPVPAFRHLVRWNDPEARIEMHLEATEDLHFVVEGHRFAMARGETIHTENCLKYGPSDASVLLRAGGWTPIADWTDPEGLFSVVLAKEGSTQSPP
jgi:dimethylhistidine N-methyltransferase